MSTSSLKQRRVSSTKLKKSLNTKQYFEPCLTETSESVLGAVISRGRLAKMKLKPIKSFRYFSAKYVKTNIEAKSRWRSAYASCFLFRNKIILHIYERVCAYIRSWDIWLRATRYLINITLCSPNLFLFMPLCSTLLSSTLPGDTHYTDDTSLLVLLNMCSSK